VTAQPGFTPHVVTLGQGPRRVLALHCTMAFGGAWAGLARIMGDRLTLICPDMPSHGHSADWDERSSFDDTVFGTSLATMDDGPMDVIGHSFGAATALRLAALHPDRVRSVTMVEPVLFSVALADAPETMADHDDRAAPFFEAIEAGRRAEAARAFNRMWSDGPAWPDLSERSRAAMTRAIHVVPDTAAFLYEDREGLLAPERLERVTMPALLIRGENAIPAMTATIEGLVRRLPDAGSAVIPGAGHMAPITDPQAVAAVFGPLLDRS
jgi:lipase